MRASYNKEVYACNPPGVVGRLERSAEMESLYLAHRQSALQHHPDRNVHGDRELAEQKFKQVPFEAKLDG